MGRAGRGLGVRLESSDSLPSGPMTISAASRERFRQSVLRCSLRGTGCIHAGTCGGMPGMLERGVEKLAAGSPVGARPWASAAWSVDLEVSC